MLDNSSVKALRPAKNRTDPTRPYFWLFEEEPDGEGNLTDVQTIFLTHSECPFKCVMCDLWKNTLDRKTPAGATPEQIRYALGRLPPAPVVKLYNNGNFFDRKALPVEDYPAIASLLHNHKHVIVENHPKLTNDLIPRFRDLLNGTLEIAMGLETIHPDVLPALNKQMTTGLFADAAEKLLRMGISVRAFVLLNPPFLTDREANIEWCIKSVRFAFEAGATACTIIPVRTGNGAMERLQKQGDYIPPDIDAIESVFKQALDLHAGRVFLDLWELGKFMTCSECVNLRKTRLHNMNLQQRDLPQITCRSCNSSP
ncbi:MAG: hypothetical protein WD355_10720 [Balneolaceae bacterium]